MHYDISLLQSSKLSVFSCRIFTIKVLNVHRDNAKTAERIFSICVCLLHFTPLFPSLMRPYPSFVPHHLWATNSALCGSSLSFDGVKKKKKEALILNIKKQAEPFYTSASVNAILPKYIALWCWKGSYCLIYWVYDLLISFMNSMFMYIPTADTISV